MTDQPPQRDPDAELRVVDFSRLDRRGPDQKDISWHWRDNRLTLSKPQHDALESLREEAHDRVDVGDLEHHEVVTDIWITDTGTIETVNWHV